MLKFLHEGERGYGAWYYNATANHYHGVDNPLGAMDGIGPDLGNDNRLIERHIQRLANGSPVDTVVQNLLEAGKVKKSLSPHEKMLNRLAKKTELGIRKSIK